LAHRHAAAVQLASGGFNRKFVLVPDGFANGMKSPFEHFQLCRGLLMKITLAEEPNDLLPAIKFGIDGEQNNFRIKAIAELLLVRTIEGVDASMHLLLHGAH